MSPQNVEQYSASYQPSQMSIMSQERNSQKTEIVAGLQKNYERENVSQNNPIKGNLDVSMQHISKEDNTNSDN